VNTFFINLYPIHLKYMRHYLIITLLIIAAPLLAQVPDSLKVLSIGPAEFQAAYKDDTNALLIDVREFFEYKKSRIKSALNIPSSGNIEAAADTINKETHLYLYCTSGYRSKRVGIKFYGEGFTKVYSLDGGIMAWRKADFPVDKKRLHKKK